MGVREDMSRPCRRALCDMHGHCAPECANDWPAIRMHPNVPDPDICKPSLRHFHINSPDPSAVWGEEYEHFEFFPSGSPTLEYSRYKPIFGKPAIGSWRVDIGVYGYIPWLACRHETGRVIAATGGTLLRAGLGLAVPAPRIEQQCSMLRYNLTMWYRRRVTLFLERATVLLLRSMDFHVSHYIPPVSRHMVNQICIIVLHYLTPPVPERFRTSLVIDEAIQDVRSLRHDHVHFQQQLSHSLAMPIILWAPTMATYHAMIDRDRRLPEWFQRCPHCHQRGHLQGDCGDDINDDGWD